MADFCLSCTRDEGLPGNDFAGWLDGLPGVEWGLCEGCGRHLFDNAGQAVCASTSELSPAGGLHDCPRCIAAFEARIARFRS